MLIGILLILMAWFIDMPLWLSIVATIIGGLKIMGGVDIKWIKK